MGPPVLGVQNDNFCIKNDFSAVQRSPKALSLNYALVEAHIGPILAVLEAGATLAQRVQSSLIIRFRLERSA